MADIISGIIDVFQQQVAAVTPEIARHLENTIRQRFGGEMTYIQTGVVESKRQRIHNGLQAGHSIAQIEQLHGIPRSTIYRLINHKKQVQSWQD